MQQKREQKENIFQWLIALPNQPIIFTTLFVLLPAPFPFALSLTFFSEVIGSIFSITY